MCVRVVSPRSDLCTSWPRANTCDTHTHFSSHFRLVNTVDLATWPTAHTTPSVKGVQEAKETYDLCLFLALLSPQDSPEEILVFKLLCFPMTLPFSFLGSRTTLGFRIYLKRRCRKERLACGRTRALAATREATVVHVCNTAMKSERAP